MFTVAARIAAPATISLTTAQNDRYRHRSTDLLAAQRGEREAYGRIVIAYQNTVTAVALAITRDVQASGDIRWLDLRLGRLRPSLTRPLHALLAGHQHGTRD
jgi:hypothetical protein